MLAGDLRWSTFGDGGRLWSAPSDATTGAALTTIAGAFNGEVVVAEAHVLVNCTDATLGHGICVYAP